MNRRIIFCDNFFQAFPSILHDYNSYNSEQN